MVGFIFQVAQQKCRFFSRASPKQKQSCSPQGASTFVRRRRGKYSAEGLSCPYVRLHLHTPWSTIHHAWGARQPTAGARAGAAVESLPAAGPAGGPPEACAARRRRCSPQALPAACTEKITYYDARGARRDRKIVPSSLTWRAVPHTPYPVPHTPYPVPMVAPPPSLDGYTPYLWRGRGGRTPLYPIPQYPCTGCNLLTDQSFAKCFLGGRGPVITYPKRVCFRLGPAHGGSKRKFRKIWVEISEITKRNLGDSGTKLWSRASPDLRYLLFLPSFHQPTNQVTDPYLSFRGHLST